ncbi:AMP-binding protein [Prescottella subtropica]|uniref:AMP-binding protein n=1 Tax=Prescottella subtropica TaxID=2545757 RepID=UPI0010F9ABA0|nr:AMP-binding protein [Prescottella subtropica]
MGSLKIHPQERVAEYTARGSWTRDTVQGLFADRVRERGPHLAVVDPVDKAAFVDVSATRLTWMELGSEVDRVAVALFDAGVRAGDVVAVRLPNTVEQIVVFFAAWRIGAIVAPLPIGADDPLVLDACNEACAGAFVTAARIGDERAADRVSALRPGIPTLRTILAFGDGLPDGVVRLDGAGADPATTSAVDADRVAAYAAARTVDPDDCVAICWTAGTVGPPKGVPHAHYESLALARSVVVDASLTADDVMLNPVASSTATGVTGTLLPWLVAGCVLVQHEPSDPDALAFRIADEKVTYTVARPSMLTALEARRSELATLTRIGVGAGPLEPATARRWQEQYGIELVGHFGTVEGVVLRSDPGAPLGTQTVLYSRTGYADGTALKLVGLDGTGEIDIPGVPGELHVKGPTVFVGYLNPARDGDPFDSAGFFATGEVFTIDGPEDEYLRYVGRLRGRRD